MQTLALDTSTPGGSVAFRRAGQLVSSRAGDGSRPHAARLPADLLDLLGAHGATLADVTLLAVGLGPGAFTGLRVGIATMQGLAVATGLPLVGVSGLDALAVAGARSGHAGRGVVGVLLETTRGEVFAARYRVDPAAADGVTPLGVPAAAAPATVLAAWRDDSWPTTWIGSGVRPADAATGGTDRIVAIETPLLAPLVAEIAERRFAAGEPFTPYALQPVYVRRPDVEIARERAQAGT